MKRMVLISILLSALFLAFACDEDKNDDIDRQDPGYFFPINQKYKWTYVHLNNACNVGSDSFSIETLSRRTRRDYFGSLQSGWDLISSGQGTTFVYRKSDSIFTNQVPITTFPSKVLVGPIKGGTYWKDAREYEYNILTIEDFYSQAAGGTYSGCAKIKRTTKGSANISYYWWAPQIGNVRREERYQGSGGCISGEELKRLDKSPEFP
jgi:hypothetical protein